MTKNKNLEIRIKKLEDRISIQEKTIKKILDFMKELGYKVEAQ